MSWEHLIKERKEEIDKMRALWKYVTDLDESVGLKPSTICEIKAKISSRIAFCERSIRDHETTNTSPTT
jgi:ferritin